MNFSEFRNFHNFQRLRCQFPFPSGNWEGGGMCVGRRLGQPRPPACLRIAPSRSSGSPATSPAPWPLQCEHITVHASRHPPRRARHVMFSHDMGVSSIFGRNCQINLGVQRCGLGAPPTPNGPRGFVGTDKPLTGPANRLSEPCYTLHTMLNF